MRRWIWVVVIAVPVLLLIGDFVYWRSAERQLEAGLQTWLKQRQAAGWQTSTGPGVAGGWPIAATLTVGPVTLQGGGPDIPGGIRWQSDRVILRLDLWRPTAFDIVFQGEQQLRLGTAPPVTATAGQLRAEVPLGFNAPPQAVDVLGRTVRIVVPDETRSPPTLTIGLLQASGNLPAMTAQDGSAVAFSISAEAIGLPRTVKWPLGSTISSFTVDGILHGKLALGYGLAQAATAWRDSGGSLAISHLALGWGPLGLTATATLALDDQLQLTGTGNSHIVGYAPALDALANGGVLSHSAATAAKAVLSLLATTPNNSDQSDVDVPLTLQYRTLSMQHVPLLRLPELDWPVP